MAEASPSHNEVWREGYSACSMNAMNTPCEHQAEYICNIWADNTYNYPWALNTHATYTTRFITKPKRYSWTRCQYQRAIVFCCTDTHRDTIKYNYIKIGRKPCWNGLNTAWIRREKKLTRCYTMVYWTYNPLNMFRALLCPSSAARDYRGDYSMWHITLCLKLVVWSGVGL
jgi:hypothetical protein